MTKQKSALIIVLVMILGICGYKAQAEMAFHTPPLTHEVLQAGPPQYLFSIDGQDESDPSTGLKEPLAITSSPDGKIFVADTGNSQVKVFTSNGKLLQTIGEGILNYPFGLTYTDAKLYVTDPNMMKISVFADQGEQLAPLLEKMQLPLAGGSLGEIIRPTGIQRGSDGNFYITDVGNQCVVVLDSKGQFLKSIGSQGTEDGHFQYPSALAISSDGKLYVSDSDNSRIQIFDQDGNYLSQVNGSQGVLSLPQGIVTTSDGTILVVDVSRHKVRAFDQEGQELWTFGGLGSGVDAFNFPNGLFVDESSGRIYVTDRENNRIQVLGYL